MSIQVQSVLFGIKICCEAKEVNFRYYSQLVSGKDGRSEFDGRETRACNKL